MRFHVFRDLSLPVESAIFPETGEMSMLTAQVAIIDDMTKVSIMSCRQSVSADEIGDS